MRNKMQMDKSFVEENYTQIQNHLQQTIKCRNTYYNHNNIANKKDNNQNPKMECVSTTFHKQFICEVKISSLDNMSLS